MIWSAVLLLLFGCEVVHLKESKWMRHVNKLVSSTPHNVQENTVRDMLKRLLPNDSEKFYVRVVPNFTRQRKDSFKISSPLAANDSRVSVTGTSGVATAMGVMHFLKYYCNSHVSWEANQLQIPSPLPTCQEKIEALDLFRYYQNVCTVSYSFAWWKWDRWERHIDWMALNGINLPLAFTGQEAIWRRVYFKLNLTQEDLDEHFVGPAFLAWGRMGNIKEWKGPLSDSWHQQTLDLQHKILKRMRDYGMIPILPAFSGNVPPAITRIFPDAEVTRLSAWSHFTSDNLTRTYFLSPSDPLFARIGSEFIKEMASEYNGTDHAYNCDPFNEMTPANNSEVYLRSVSKAIFKAILEADRKAVWVLQAWMFHSSFWTKSAAKAFITGVPRGRMIVLDLNAEVDPLFENYDSFFGQPFIFCLLSNYGGVDGLFGNVQVLTKNLEVARNYTNSSMVGIGLTPEGINQNYFLYDLMLEMSWRSPQFNLSEWAGIYASRRYGTIDFNLIKAWQLLMKSVYNCTSPLKYHGHGELIQQRPNFKRQPDAWYDKNDLVQAWDLMIGSINAEVGENGIRLNDSNETSNLIINDDEIQLFESNEPFYSGPSEEDPVQQNFVWTQETFKHDLVDVTRQVLQNIGSNLVLKIRDSYRLKSTIGLNTTGSILEELLDDLDYLLGTSKDFLLGSWLRDAAEWGSTEEEKSQFISNALYQISLWGPNGEILDYATKQWNGVVKSYFKPRWVLFKNELLRCLETGKNFKQNSFNKMVFKQAEKPFAEDTSANFQTSTTGDILEFVKKLHKKYRLFVFTY